MANEDFVFRVALGAGRYYVDRVIAGVGELAVCLFREIEDDSTLRTRDTLAAILAVGTNLEANWAGGTPYARQEASGVLRTNTSATQIDADVADFTWLNAHVPETPQQLAKLIIFYAPSGYASAQDGDMIPLTGHYYPEIANGADITATIDEDGFYRAIG